jgi:hypothetical protein
LTYVIFEVKSENSGKINKLIKDDLVSRQSILTRDSNSLDIKGDYSYVKIEGSKEGIKRAEELAKELELKKLDEKKAKKINEKIAEQEDSAASGMGMIFD